MFCASLREMDAHIVRAERGGGRAGAHGRTSRPPISISTAVFRSPLPSLFVLVSEFEKGADPREKSRQMVDKILEVSNNPHERPASHQRTSGPICEELFESPLGIASLEMEPLAAAAATSTEASAAARKPITREAASSCTVTTTVLQPFLSVPIINVSLLGIRQDLVGLGNVGELLSGPLLLFLVLIRVVLQR